MQEKRNSIRWEYPLVDFFRMIAALLVAAIHVAPFQSYSENADYFFTYCIGRIAVPFFLMVTGYFVLGSKDLEQQSEKVRKTLLNLGKLYGLVILIYLPINYYSGNLPRSVGEVFRQIFFDGTFYHLWYLPGTMIGIVIVFLLFRYTRGKTAVFVTFLLYLVGIFGDSYYGLVLKVPGIKEIYDFIFGFSSYTRNGIFFTPVFLMLGAWIGREQYRISKEAGKIGLIISILGLLAEGGLTRYFELQKHNSMYLCLIPASFFLMNLLLLRKTKVKKEKRYMMLRNISLWIYLFHPICIIGVRGIAKLVNKKAVFVDNSLVFYILVCVSSFVVSFILQYGLNFVKNKNMRF